MNAFFYILIIPFSSLQPLEIRHIAGLICKTIDLALTPHTIKAGFRSCGIMPFDPNVFNDGDYIQPVSVNTVDHLQNGVETEDNVELAIDDSVPNEIETNSITQEPLSPTSSNNVSILNSIGPLQGATPRKPSNRGRKGMKSAVLTSPEVLLDLKKKSSVREMKKNAKAMKTKIDSK